MAVAWCPIWVRLMKPSPSLSWQYNWANKRSERERGRCMCMHGSTNTQRRKRGRNVQLLLLWDRLVCVCVEGVVWETCGIAAWTFVLNHTWTYFSLLPLRGRAELQTLAKLQEDDEAPSKLLFGNYWQLFKYQLWMNKQHFVHLELWLLISWLMDEWLLQVTKD